MGSFYIKLVKKGCSFSDTVDGSHPYLIAYMEIEGRRNIATVLAVECRRKGLAPAMQHSSHVRSGVGVLDVWSTPEQLSR